MTDTSNFNLSDFETSSDDLLVGDVSRDAHYKLNSQFKLEVLRVGKPSVSKFNGMPQLPVTVAACDFNDKAVGKETTIWLTLPLLPKNHTEEQVDQAMKARDSLAGILRAWNDEFSAYKKDGKNYFNKDGTQLVGDAIKTARHAAQKRVVAAAKDLATSGEPLVGVQFYATRATYQSKKDGQLKAVWQGFGPTANPKVSVIGDADFFYEVA